MTIAIMIGEYRLYAIFFFVATVVAPVTWASVVCVRHFRFVRRASRRASRHARENPTSRRRASHSRVRRGF